MWTFRIAFEESSLYRLTVWTTVQCRTHSIVYIVSQLNTTCYLSPIQSYNILTVDGKKKLYNIFLKNSQWLMLLVPLPNWGPFHTYCARLLLQLSSDLSLEYSRKLIQSDSPCDTLDRLFLSDTQARHSLSLFPPLSLSDSICLYLSLPKNPWDSLEEVRLAVLWFRCPHLTLGCSGGVGEGEGGE